MIYDNLHLIFNINNMNKLTSDSGDVGQFLPENKKPHWLPDWPELKWHESFYGSEVTNNRDLLIHIFTSDPVYLKALENKDGFVVASFWHNTLTIPQYENLKTKYKIENPQQIEEEVNYATLLDEYPKCVQETVKNNDSISEEWVLENILFDLKSREYHWINVVFQWKKWVAVMEKSFNPVKNERASRQLAQIWKRLPIDAGITDRDMSRAVLNPGQSEIDAITASLPCNKDENKRLLIWKLMGMRLAGEYLYKTQDIDWWGRGKDVYHGFFSNGSFRIYETFCTVIIWFRSLDL